MSQSPEGQSENQKAGQPRGESDLSRNPGRREEGALWSIFGYLLSGLLVWGGIGYFLDRWLGYDRVFTLVGLLLGMGSSLYLVWLRFGRHSG
jgi:ATP synthase protein I